MNFLNTIPNSNIVNKYCFIISFINCLLFLFKYNNYLLLNFLVLQIISLIELKTQKSFFIYIQIFLNLLVYKYSEYLDDIIIIFIFDNFQNVFDYFYSIYYDPQIKNIEEILLIKLIFLPFITKLFFQTNFDRFVINLFTIISTMLYYYHIENINNLIVTKIICGSTFPVIYYVLNSIK